MSAILHTTRAAVDVHVPFHIEQMHVQGSTPSGVRRNKHRPPAPRYDTTSQMIRLGGYFIVATTYSLSKRLPMCMQRGVICCVVHSSETIIVHSAIVQWRCRLANSSPFVCCCWVFFVGIFHYLVSGVAFESSCGTLIHKDCRDVS